MLRHQITPPGSYSAGTSGIGIGFHWLSSITTGRFDAFWWPQAQSTPTNVQCNKVRRLTLKHASPQAESSMLGNSSSPCCCAVCASAISNRLSHAQSMLWLQLTSAHNSNQPKSDISWYLISSYFQFRRFTRLDPVVLLQYITLYNLDNLIML